MEKSTKITTSTSELNAELKKNSIPYNAVYIILLCIVGFLLAINYVAVFNSKYYWGSLSGKAYVGVVNFRKFDNTQKGQLLVVDKISGANEISIGDEIFYAGNGGEGSGEVLELHFAKKYVLIKTNNSQVSVDTSTIIGKVTKKIDKLGYIFWTFQNTLGLIILNGVLVMLFISRTIWTFCVEPSRKGKELRKNLVFQRNDNRRKKKMLKNYKLTGLDVDSFELLDGDFEINRQKIIENAKNHDISGVYQYLLQKVHRVFVCKRKLTVEDRKKITNCIEQMCLAEHFDLDIEYRLTDLILKTNVVNFDLKNFIDSCKNYLSNKHSYDDLECFMSVLYVLLKRNKNLRKYEMLDLCENLEIYLCRANFVEETNQLLSLCNFIKKII